MPIRPNVIGLDLESTVIDLDHLIHRLAVEQGSANETEEVGRVRARLAGGTEGDSGWRRLAARARGDDLDRARPVAGVVDFLLDARTAGYLIRLIGSQNYQADGPRGPAEYRQAGLEWLERHGFFDPAGIGLNRRAVHFVSSPGEKLDLIRDFGCRAFVDADPEVFADPDFPQWTTGLLLTPDPGPSPAGLLVARDWPEARETIFGLGLPAGQVTAMLGRSLKRIRRVRKTRFSILYQVSLDDRRQFGVKFYNKVPAGRPNRLTTEYKTLEFLWGQGLREIPRPVTSLPSKSLAIFSWVEGRHPKADEIGPDQIDEAINLVIQLKSLSGIPEAARMPRSVGACFSLKEIRLRHEELTARMVTQKGLAESRLGTFLEDTLNPAFEAAWKKAEPLYRGQGIGPEDILPPGEWTLSHGDMGFHNTLMRPDGSLSWIHLEKFGWDDPVRIISNFLIRHSETLALELKRKFIRGVLDGLDRGGRLRSRLAVAYPLWVLMACFERLARLSSSDSTEPWSVGSPVVDGPDQVEGLIADVERSLADLSGNGLFDEA